MYQEMYQDGVDCITKGVDRLDLATWPSSTVDSSESPDAEERRTFRMDISLPNFSLAKLSVVILALATVTDVALSRMSVDSVRPRTSLGSAAISSFTETFSPILPFAGGLDLRRDDYWSSPGNWFEKLHSVAVQIHDAFASAEDVEEASSASSLLASSLLGIVPGSGDNSTVRASRPVGRTTKVDRTMALSAPQPFVSVDAIAELTLGEVTELFYWSIESSRQGFDERRFVDRLPPRVRKVLVAMKTAIAKSRGSDAIDWMTPPTEAEGELDALKFSAAMRVLAEWRVVRQVPDGYKGYAVGMSLGHKDVLQNVVKIEQVAHAWLNLRRENFDESCVHCQLYTPTLRELMRYEIETGANPENRLPRLNDKTGSMGLLWTRRQLQYQAQLFENALDQDRFASTKDAVMSAYKTVYDRYHGWAVQKIFNYSFQAAPDFEVVIRHMNPRLLEKLKRSAEVMNLSAEKKSSAATSDSERRGEENPLEAFLNHIGGEWDKFLSSVGKIFKPDSDEPKFRGGGQVASSQTSELDTYINLEMTKDAHNQITSYLRVVRPLLKNLKILFDDMNMDDPTRV
jgi:hypothetical protein